MAIASTIQNANTIKSEVKSSKQLESKSSSTRKRKRDFKVLTIAIHKIGCVEYDITCTHSGKDGHIRYENDRWIYNIFKGGEHLDSLEVGTGAQPHWGDIINEIL